MFAVGQEEDKGTSFHYLAPNVWRIISLFQEVLRRYYLCYLVCLLNLQQNRVNFQLNLTLLTFYLLHYNILLFFRQTIAVKSELILHYE